jgi:DNA-binding transcriptional MerR regulator
VSYRISQVAERTGFSPATLRYYERIGLLPPTERADNGYRRYDDRAVHRLTFISRAKDVGLALDEIAELADLWDDDECSPVQERLRQVVEQKRQDARDRIVELFAFSAQLDRVVDRLSGRAADGPCDDTCGCMTATDATLRPVVLGRSAEIACTLAPGDVAGRVEEWQTLLRDAVAREPIAGGWRVHLENRPGLAARLADLAANEQQCCSFFAFAVRLTGAGVALEVTAPDEAQDLVAALVGVNQSP